MEREANTADWALLAEYGPGQVNGIRNPEMVDDETMIQIERARYFQAERPVLTREAYTAQRDLMRDPVLRFEAGICGDASDIQAEFIKSYPRRRLV